MSEKLTFLKLAEKVLLEEKKPLTGKQIWEVSKEKGYDELISTQGKTPGNTIHTAIFYDMRDKASSKFIREIREPVSC